MKGMNLRMPSSEQTQRERLREANRLVRRAKTPKSKKVRKRMQRRAKKTLKTLLEQKAWRREHQLEDRRQRHLAHRASERESHGSRHSGTDPPDDDDPHPADPGLAGLLQAGVPLYLLVLPAELEPDDG